MELRPVSVPKWVKWPIGALIIALSAPVWFSVAAIVWIMDKLERLLDPPGWRRVFAFWPVECDPWPEDGYSGWLWLEPVWRNPQAPGWTKYRREAPQ